MVQKQRQQQGTKTLLLLERHTHTHFKQDEKEDPAEPVFHGDEGFSVCNQPKL